MEPWGSPRGSVGEGVVWTLILHLAGQAVLGLLFWIARQDDVALPLILIGVSQLVYLVPTGIVFLRRGQSTTVKTMAILAGIVFLLNAACWGIVMASL